MRPSIQCHAARLATVCLLALVWLGMMPGAVAGLFALLAQAEGSHGVEVIAAGDQVEVVLTHGAQQCRCSHEQIHHHGMLARVLASIAMSPENQPDHVAKFVTATSVADTERAALAGAPLTAATAAAVFIEPIDSEWPRIVVRNSWLEMGGAEHAPTPSLAELRSTLLLI